MSGVDVKMVQSLVATYSVKAVTAILILLFGYWLSRRFSRFLVTVFERHSMEATLTKFLGSIIHYIILIAVIIAAASQLGINTSSFLAVLGTAGLAIGLALKDSLSNFSSGVVLILFRPFKVGDAVTVAGETGEVEEITIFNTIINTADNQRKLIPNSKISNDTITNITANPVRRIDLVARISYKDDVRDAQRVLRQVVEKEPRILAEPPVTVAIADLADSSVNIVVRPWVKTSDYWDVRFALTENIKLAFDEAGLTIPYPQRQVHGYDNRNQAPMGPDREGALQG